MDKRAEAATAALDIMREWDWQHWYDDACDYNAPKSLSLIVNRLALEGIVRPAEAVLTLLCRGELTAWGYYRWRKYQHGDFYQLEGAQEILKPLRWQALADSIAEEFRSLAGNEWLSDTVDLERLGIKACARYEWEFGDNRFSIAICPPDTDTWSSNYLEEWYSAWDIEIRLSHPKPILIAQEVEQEPVKLIPNGNKGGRPPAADWELAALEIAGRYYRGDFKPQTIADVGRELASWLGNQDLHPSDSVVRIHAKRIFEAFQAWEKE